MMLARKELLSAALALTALLVWHVTLAQAEPTPTKTRHDTRPTATPIPGAPRMAIDPVGPITLPAKVSITARRLNPAEKIFGIRVWFKTPTQSPEPKTKAYCAKIARLSKTKDAATITCNLNDRAPEGSWLLCPYVPDEPGRAFAGLYEGCQTVEVRRSARLLRAGEDGPDFGRR